MWMLLFLLAMPAWSACGPGCFEFRDGCACDAPKEIAQPVKPSDEKPKQSGRPSFESEGLTLDERPSLAAQDQKRDDEKVAADREGKKAAGIK